MEEVLHHPRSEEAASRLPCQDAAPSAWATSSRLPSPRIAARSMTAASSRTFPGQGSLSNRSMSAAVGASGRVPSRLAEAMEVVAFGFPFGTGLAQGRQRHPAVSVNVGRISSLRRKGDALDAIQLDAAVNVGNSGGPLLDKDGKVIGVIAATVGRGTGVNFALGVKAPKVTTKSGQTIPISIP
jgi:Trypsin-like peptidase domain